MILKPKWITLISKKRLLVFIFTSVLILAAFSVVTVFVIRHYQERSNTSQSAEDIYKAKKAELERTLKNAKDTDKKLLTTEELTQLALDNGDTATGLEYAKQAVKMSSTVNNNAILGFAAERSGDKQLAISSYIKAVELSPKSNDPYSDYMYYTIRKQMLEVQ